MIHWVLLQTLSAWMKGSQQLSRDDHHSPLACAGTQWSTEFPNSLLSRNALNGENYLVFRMCPENSINELVAIITGSIQLLENETHLSSQEISYLPDYCLSASYNTPLLCLAFMVGIRMVGIRMSYWTICSHLSCEVSASFHIIIIHHSSSFIIHHHYLSVHFHRFEMSWLMRK